MSKKKRAKRVAKKRVAKKKNAQKRTKKQAPRRKSSESTRASTGLAAKLHKRSADALALTKAARALQGQRIVVAFADDLEVPQTRGFEDKPGDWATLRKLGAKGLRPIFSDVNMVNRIEEQSRRVLEYVPRYRNTFMLELQRSSATNAVLKVLRSWCKEIRLAYEDREPVLATGGPSAALCSVRSGHLAPAPEGVHASAAWAFPGGQGELQVCVDLEKAWTKHQRLQHPGRVHKLYGGIVAAGSTHGTAVLGILCGSRILGSLSSKQRQSRCAVISIRCDFAQRGGCAGSAAGHETAINRQHSPSAPQQEERVVQVSDRPVCAILFVNVTTEANRNQERILRCRGQPRRVSRRTGPFLSVRPLRAGLSGAGARDAARL
jgi:hypothetical protein